LYRLMSEDERTRLVENIVNAMKPVEKEEIKLRQIEHFYKADPEYGKRVAEGLGLPIKKDS
ncbi:catalase-related domain-containing protein, partial [Bacillus subtilis]